jgi:hypothetical protein
MDLNFFKRSELLIGLIGIGAFTTDALPPSVLYLFRSCASAVADAPIDARAASFPANT